MVFASPPRQLYRDEKTPVRLPGLITLTTLSGRENLRPSTGTLQKHMPTPTQTATPYTTGPLTIIRRKSIPSASRTASNFIHRDKKYYLHLSVFTSTLYCCLRNFVSRDKSCNLENFLRQPHKPAIAHIKNWLPAMYC